MVQLIFNIHNIPPYYNPLRERKGQLTSIIVSLYHFHLIFSALKCQIAPNIILPRHGNTAFPQDLSLLMKRRQANPSPKCWAFSTLGRKQLDTRVESGAESSQRLYWAELHTQEIRIHGALCLASDWKPSYLPSPAPGSDSGQAQLHFKLQLYLNSYILIAVWLLYLRGQQQIHILKCLMNIFM